MRVYPLYDRKIPTMGKEGKSLMKQFETVARLFNRISILWETGGRTMYSVEIMSPQEFLNNYDKYITRKNQRRYQRKIGFRKRG